MTPTQRIIANTLATYGRNLFGICLTLFSSRWVLNALGASDFGLYGLVGALVVMIGFLNGVMGLSASRHYAYAIGRSDSLPLAKDGVEEVRKWFNTAISVHTILPAILIAIGYPVGVYCIRSVLAIPPDRIQACILVFRFSLITAFISMLSVPFTAMFTAKQLITELAFFGVVSSALNFAVAFWLTQAGGDRLVLYAILMFLVHAGIPVLQSLRAGIIFKECRIRPGYLLNAARIRELVSFAGWQLFGCFGWLLRGQGIAVLVNLFFGATVNASLSIANQVSSQAASLSAAMTGAFMPAITTAEGGGQRPRMLALSLKSCKWSAFLVLLFAMPLLLEIETVLRLWLRNPPPHAAELCSFMIIVLLADRVTDGYTTALLAQGRIAAYQVTLGSGLMLSLPLAWLFFKLGCGPVSVGYAWLLTTAFCSLGRLYFGKRQLQMAPGEWARTVLLPLLLIVACAWLAGMAVIHGMPPGFRRVLVTSIVTMAVSLGVGWRVVVNAQERSVLTDNVVRAFSFWRISP